MPIAVIPCGSKRYTDRSKSVAQALCAAWCMASKTKSTLSKSENGHPCKSNMQCTPTLRRITIFGSNQEKSGQDKARVSPVWNNQASCSELHDLALIIYSYHSFMYEGSALLASPMDRGQVKPSFSCGGPG